MSLKSALTAIGDKIRGYLGTDSKYKLEDMPSAIDECCTTYGDERYTNGYDEGHTNGHDEGYSQGHTEGVEQGKQAEQDAFWEAYQDGGKRKDYSYAFPAIGWTDNNFYPRYNMEVTQGNYMFRACKITNLKRRLEELGITIDYSKCASMTYLFASSYITDVGVVDARSLTNQLQYFVYDNPRIVNFEKLILNENNTYHTSAFQFASGLEEIRIEGVIANSGINFQWSKKLSHDSLMSIINALKDNSGTSTWNTITFGAENLAKLTADELFIMEQKQWDYN